MQMLTTFFWKLASSLSLSYENTVGTNLRPVKAVPRDERFLSLRPFCLNHAHRAFNWPKYTCINLSDICTY